MKLPSSQEETQVGSYFVANYPPFGSWKGELLPEAEAAVDRAREGAAPLGLYLHIPFCRKRCRFCYFRVYTDKSSRDVERYVAALAREVEIYRSRGTFASRPLEFAYFGGGTPSFLSERQLLGLAERLRRAVSWDGAREVTFECEPGTLTEGKVRAIREIAVTRLSLGVESFDDAVLEENGRAHRSGEVYRAYRWARDAGFAQVNVDLIAGMVGETRETWQHGVEETLALAPDSVTIYPMELPWNTIYARSVLEGTLQVPDWRTKREWIDHAFTELERAGYRISSAYTVVRGPECRFVYRDALWHGADMVGTGVASFSHLSGVHFQNVDGFEEYCAALEAGRLPLGRALAPTRRQLFIRELVLQLKLGRIEGPYFRAKFGVDVLEALAEPLRELAEEGLLELEEDGARLTREGLLRVDALLPLFFEPEHRGARYT
ncbi:MAG: coproporphyrinogen III oxidase family protein [Planctomycetes bacterium]|nr:coproporphyrinogen III oxidase family protein [Planctomycetota bacterium]